MQRMKQDERIGIVEKYDQSFEHAEDESEESYDLNATDWHGFFIRSHHAPISKHQEEKRRSIEIKRREKWLKMVRHWDRFVGTEKLAKRVYKGIPQGIRGDVWRLLLEVHKYSELQPKVYEKMKYRAFECSEDIKQIDMDVNRTYRNHIMFAQRYNIKQRQLFCVLAAYSIYNSEVGYCQGMSQIVALLLMYMDEEDAFWALHSLLYGKKHKMHGFFIPGFPKLLRFQHHHDEILTKLLPKLRKHLDKNEVFTSLYTMKWFFQCFLDRAPFSLSLRLWDIYTLEGEKLLIAMSYTTLKLHKRFLKNQDMDGIISFLQEELVKDFGKSDDAVVNYLKDCMAELKNSAMDKPPQPSQDETPKLPFGDFISATAEEEKASVKVPYFTKHSIDITTLLHKRSPSHEEDLHQNIKLGKEVWPTNVKKSSSPAAQCLDSSMQTEAPSFSELSAVLDSVHREASITMDMSFTPQLSFSSLEGGRPQSIYDNVPTSNPRFPKRELN